MSLHLLRRFAGATSLATLTATALLLGTFCSAACADQIKVTLSGDKEVPPVKTAAMGSGNIMINADMSVSGSVTTTGIDATMAHIHQAAAGMNGPVIIPLAKSADGSTWSVPAQAKLSEAQYAAYKAGELYINVHSAANKGGEIRGQLK